MKIFKIEKYQKQSKHTMKIKWLNYDAHKLKYCVKVKLHFGSIFYTKLILKRNA